MNNLSLYCALVDAKIRASDKDLPVQTFDENQYQEDVLPKGSESKITKVGNVSRWAKYMVNAESTE